MTLPALVFGGLAIFLAALLVGGWSLWTGADRALLAGLSAVLAVLAAAVWVLG